MNLLAFAILFSGVLQGIILAFLLFLKKTNRLQNRLLAFLIFIVVIHLSLVAIDIENLFIRFPHLSRISWVIPLLYGPLILLLTQSIVKINFTFKKRHLLYFIPLVIYLIALSPYFLLSGTEKVRFLIDTTRVSKADLGIYNSLSAFIHIGFVAFALKIFYSYKKRLTGYFSDPGRVDMEWLRQFLWLVLGVMVLSEIAFFSKKFGLAYLSEIYPYNFLVVVFLIYWVAYKLLLDPSKYTRQQASISAETMMEDQEELSVKEIGTKYLKTALSAREVEKIKVKLVRLMQEEKPYLNPDLSIDDLSNLLDVKRHHLSQVINLVFEKNFFEFVNGYRVEEFKKQAQDFANQHLSILGIALNCGFNSKATFNTVFKKQEGVTPSAYIKAQQGINL